MPRPKASMSNALMVAAARMYHLEDLSKVEIAKNLGTNRRHVAELLTRARQEGLIRFDIFQTAAQELEKQFGQRYPHLKRVIVRPGARISEVAHYPGLIKQLAIGASGFFDELPKYFPRKSSLNVAVTGGRQILAFANSVPAEDRHDIYVQLPALIGRGHHKRTTHINPIVNASVLWSRCGYLPGHCQYATVLPFQPREPGREARKAARTEMEKAEKNEAIREVVRAMDNIDVIFTSIGLVNPNNVPAKLRGQVVTYSLLEAVVTPEQLEAEGALGSMAYCVFDEFGNGREDWRFWLTAGHYSERHWGIEFYKRMVEVGKIVVTFGSPFNVRALKTALKAKLFNVLVIDEYSAQKLLEQE